MDHVYSSLYDLSLLYDGDQFWEEAHVNQFPNEEQPFTWEELRARVQESEQQIARGEVFSEEESDRMFDEFIVNELGIAL